MFHFSGTIQSPCKGVERPIRSVVLSAREPAPRLLRRLGRLFFPCTLAHTLDTRNVIANAVTALVDLGSTNASGQIRMYDEGRITRLATINLGFPAFLDAASGLCQAAGLPITDTNAANDGIAAEFEVVDRDETLLWSGDVAEGDSDLDAAAGLEINSRDIVRIDNLFYAATP